MQRVTKQLASLVDSGDFYEALQIYKATHRRLVAKKQYVVAKDLLESGTKLMIKNKEYLQANELISLLISLLIDSEDYTAIEMLLNLFELYPSSVNISNPLKEATKWSEKARIATENIKKAHPALLLLTAKRYWTRGDYGESLRSFLIAESSSDFVQMLSDWQSKAVASECDLIGVRAVLLLLTFGNLKEANEVFDAYLDLFFKTKESRTPLINFVQFLLMTLERDAYPFYQQLEQAYAPSLERDPEFAKYMTRISEIFYKISPAKSANLLGDLMKSFLGGAQ